MKSPLKAVLLSDHTALIDYVINRYILICSSEVGFLCRYNTVYSDAILLPARRVGTKRALSNMYDTIITLQYAYCAQHGMQQFVRYVFFLVLVKKTLY